MDCSLPGFSVHGIYQTRIPTQGSNPGLLHCRQIIYHCATWEALICRNKDYHFPWHFLCSTHFSISMAICSMNSLRDFLAGRGRAAQLASIGQMSRQVSLGSDDVIRQMGRQVSRGSLAIIKQMSRQVSRGSAGDYEADEQAGVSRLSWRLSCR